MAPVGEFDIRAQVDRILSSKVFASSPRMCRFLRFIVECALKNESEQLNEFAVAVEVFDRNASYDSSVDSIVRVEARRLRQKLATYYSSLGVSDAVRIELAPGSYVPRFVSSEAAERRLTSVAVLPFVNMSPEPEQEYFCDGITEEILNALASVEGLAVVARTSSFQFKGKSGDIREIGMKLGAQVVVEGSVRKAGRQLRITAQAINCDDGFHLWSQTYRRELEDIFAIQEEISGAIASTLQTKLPRRTVVSVAPDAHEKYCKALVLIHQQNVPGLYGAMAAFRELMRLYPKYAAPYAGMATALAAVALYGAVSSAEVALELRRYAETAIDLDPQSADAWTVMAGISAHWEYRWSDAEDRFRKAIALQPSSFPAHSWYAMVLTMMGRFDEAERETALTMRLNPLGASGAARLGFLAYLKGDDPRAVELCEQALEMDPTFGDALLTLGFVHLRRGKCRPAVEVLSMGTEPSAVNLGALAAAYLQWGKVRDGERVVQRLREMSRVHYVTPLAFAIAALGRGDVDAAMDLVEAAVADRTIYASFVPVHPYYEPLRRNGRYAAVLRQLTGS